MFLPEDDPVPTPQDMGPRVDPWATHFEGLSAAIRSIAKDGKGSQEVTALQHLRILLAECPRRVLYQDDSFPIVTTALLVLGKDDNAPTLTPPTAAMASVDPPPELAASPYLAPCQRRWCVEALETLCRSAPEPVLIQGLYPLLLPTNRRNLLQLAPHPVTVKRLLCRILQTRRYGVLAVVDTLLTGMSEDRMEAYEHVTTLIMTPPSAKKAEDYLDGILPQVSGLLSLPRDTNPHTRHRKVFACALVDALLKKYRARTKQFVIRPFLWPLLLQTTATEAAVTKAIETLHGLHCTKIVGSNSPHVLEATLSTAFHGLFWLHCFVHKGASSVKRLVHDILVTLLHSSPMDFTLHALHSVVDQPKCPGPFVYATGESGGVCVVEKEEDDDEHASSTECVEPLLGLLKEIPDTSDIVAEFFVLIMNKVFRGTGDSTVGALVLSGMTERMGSVCLRKGRQLLSVVEQTLSLSMEGDCASPETLGIPLGILELLLSQCVSLDTRDPAVLRDLRKMEPSLEALSKRADCISTMASTCRMWVRNLVKIGETSRVNVKGSEEGTKALNMICKNLSSDIPALIGGSLMELRSYLSQHIEERDKVLDIFLSHAGHPDSYVYLAAINGLVDLAALDSSLTVPRLADTYRSAARDEAAVKLADAMTLVALRLDRAFSRLVHVVANSLLVRTHHAQGPLVRASALQCLGQICGTVKHGLRTFALEVTTAVIAVVRLDKDPLCRRAAVSCLRECLRSVGTGLEIPALFQDWREVVAVISYTEKITLDEVLRWHCQEFLLSLNDLTMISVAPSVPPSITLLSS